MLYALIDVIGYLVQIIIMLVILQFVLGLLMAFNVVNPHNEVFGALWRTCNQLLIRCCGRSRRSCPIPARSICRRWC